MVIKILRCRLLDDTAVAYHAALAGGKYLYSFSCHETSNGVRCKSQPTVIIGCPKKEDSIARVDRVKLCCPLSHLVISHGRLPSERANSAFDNPFCVIRCLSKFTN